MTDDATSPRYRLVGYGQGSWNKKTQGVKQPITDEEAARRHRAGEPYGLVLTGADGDGDDPGLPLVGVILNEHGISVGFYDHDADKANLSINWKPSTDDGLLRPTQIDRRAGNTPHVPRDQVVSEYLKLGNSPVPWVRWIDGRPVVLDRREIDLGPFARPAPDFGHYDDFLDPSLPQRIWPGLPDLVWIGPERPVER